MCGFVVQSNVLSVQPKEWLPYRNEEFGFQFSHPNSWRRSPAQLTEEGGRKSLSVAFGDMFNANIIVKELEPSVQALGEYTHASLEEAKEMEQSLGAKIINHGPICFMHEQKSYYMEVAVPLRDEASNATINTISKQYWTVRDGKVFLLVFSLMQNSKHA